MRAKAAIREKERAGFGSGRWKMEMEKEIERFDCGPEEIADLVFEEFCF